MQSARYFCQIIIKLEFSRQSFEKSSDIKYDENRPVGGAELFHADKQTEGRTGRQAGRS
jgi:hypothetical protein